MRNIMHYFEINAMADFYALRILLFPKIGIQSKNSKPEESKQKNRIKGKIYRLIIIRIQIMNLSF